MFIRVFSNQDEATSFAAMVKGILSIRYSWDDMLSMIVREYVVKF